MLNYRQRKGDPQCTVCRASKGFDSSVLVGQELTHIIFTSNTIHFAFSGDISVTLTSSFVHDRPPHDLGRNQVVPVQTSSLMSLLGKTVSDSTSEPDGTLRLHFEDGEGLTFLDDSREYESYTVRIGDREIIA